VFGGWKNLPRKMKHGSGSVTGSLLRSKVSPDPGDDLANHNQLSKYLKRSPGSIRVSLSSSAQTLWDRAAVW